MDDESILISIKEQLGIDKNYGVFDTPIIAGINSALFALSQIGVGPSAPFSITGETETWSDFLGERRDLTAVKTYVYIKTRLVFDPPSSSFVIAALENMAKEYEWRLNVQAEEGVIEDAEADISNG